MTTGVIFDIKRFAVHDGPGIRTTVFFKGCPLSCGWCHNPESQSAAPDVLYRIQRCIRCEACIEACPRDARARSNGGIARDASLCILCGTCAEKCPSGAIEIVGRTRTVGELMVEIERDTPFFDQSGGGVTFSGGEPLSQPRFLRDLLVRCGEHDIHRAVDTCGFANPEVLRSVAGDVDLFLFDLKLMDAAEHVKHTGVKNELIHDNLKMLSGMGNDIHIRIPIIPGVTDSRENLNAIGRFVADLPNRHLITLLAHHSTAMEKYPRFGLSSNLPGGIDSPSRSELSRIAFDLGEHGLEVAY